MAEHGGRRDWPDEWADLGCHEPLYSPRRVAPGLYCCRRNGTWSAAARWASAALPGVWFQRDYGLTWVCGSRRLWLVDDGKEGPVLAAGAIVRSLGLEPGGSIGSCATSLLRALGPLCRNDVAPALVRKGAWIGYHDCDPGIYEDCVKWDANSYYFAFWERLPSLRCWLTSGGKVLFGRMAAKDEEMWKRVNMAVAGHKVLRNAMVSCAYGHLTPGWAWHAGELIRWMGDPGRFRGAGLLCVRSAWELCREVAADTNSYYSHTDSVICAGDRLPGRWGDWGFGYKEEARGEADIRGFARYRVGRKATALYDSRDRFLEAEPLPPPPPVCYYRQWLNPLCA